MAVIIVKDNKEQKFDSLNGACKGIDSTTSGKNKQSAIRFILSKGYEIKEGATAEEIKDAKSKKTRNSTTWIERIIKKLANVDNALIERIIDEQQKILKNLKTAKDIEKVHEITERLEKARNPQVTKESFIEYCSQAWDDHQASEKE